MSASKREGVESGTAGRLARKRRKLERIIAGRRREPMDYVVMSAVLLASLSALVAVLGGKETASPLQVSLVAGALVILATRQLMESATASRRDRALKEYLDLRLGEVDSAGEDGVFPGKSTPEETE